MAAIVNDRDVLMQATSPRVIAGAASKGIILSASSSAFQVSTAGVGSPTSITLTAALVGITGAAVTFSTSPAATLSVSGNVATLTYANMSANSVAVTATVVDGGTTYTNTQTITKLQTLGSLATKNSVSLSSEVTGYLSSGSVTGLGALASLDTINLASGRVTGMLNGATQVSNLGSLAYASSIAANQIGAGTLAAGVIYSGYIEANKITAGTLNGVNLNFGSGHTTSGKAFEITNTGVVWADNLFGGIGDFNNNYYTTSPSLNGTTYSNKAGVQGSVAYGNSDTGTAGLYGLNYRNGAAGLVGHGNGYDFYAIGPGPNGPFTGAHDALIPKSTDVEIGDIVVDVSLVARNGVSNTLFEVAKSSSPNQKTAIGVVSMMLGGLADNVLAAFRDNCRVSPDEHNPMLPGFEDAAPLYDVIAMNALGEGQINVCGEGGDIDAGDYIVTSSIPGKGMRQADDLLHNYTVARAREACTFSTASEVKTIACIYLCG